MATHLSVLMLHEVIYFYTFNHPSNTVRLALYLFLKYKKYFHSILLMMKQLWEGTYSSRNGAEFKSGPLTPRPVFASWNQVPQVWAHTGPGQASHIPGPLGNSRWDF